MARIVIVSNRVAMPSERGPRAGGLAITLKDVLVPGALWFGWSGRVSEGGNKNLTFVERSGVHYATFDLNEEDYQSYYVGFANRALWPLLHMRLGLMEFQRKDYLGYRRVNSYFARALLPQLRSTDRIWVHDYHLFPFAHELRALGFLGPIGFFLHVPFVPAAVLSVLPKCEELVVDMLQYDVVGFHTKEYKDNFCECARQLVGADIRDDVIVFGTRQCRVVVTPVGIDARLYRQIAGRAVLGKESQRLIDSLVGRSLMIGVDRLDYSKGLPNRFKGFGQLLERYPRNRLQVSYLQIAVRSREDVQEYRDLQSELNQLVGELNGRYAEFDWVPLRYLTRALSRQTLAGFYRLARVGVVTPLRDGMNLVAHEYIASQEAANPGVLILSKFAGAACYFPEALLVNPYDADEIADAMDQALWMNLKERQSRFESLFSSVLALSPDKFQRKFLLALEEMAPISQTMSNKLN